MPQFTNTRWENACQALAIGRNITQAYADGGFVGNQTAASRFFKRKKVMARVAEIQNDKHAADFKIREIAIKKAGLDESWIIERLKYGIELGLRGEPVLDADGNPTGKFGKRDLKAAMQGLGHAISIKGMAIHRHEIGGPGDFARLTDAELDAELEATAERLGLAREAIEPLLLTKREGIED